MAYPPPQNGSMYPPQQGSMYPPQQHPQGSMYPPQQHPQGSMYPPQQGSMYPPQQPPQGSMYPPQQHPQGSMYPPQQHPQGSMYPPQQPYGAQPGMPGQPGMYPPQGSMYPPQQPGMYPPQQPGMGMPGQPGMYPGQQPYGQPGMQPGMGHPGAMMTGPAEVTVQFSGRKLADKDFLSKSDPFLIIYKKKNLTPGERFQNTSYHGEMYAAEWTAIQKTEVVKDNLNPNWKPFKINVQMVGGMDAPILLEVVDWDSNGTNDLIGRQMSSLNELKTMREVILLDPKKKNSFRYKNSGTLTVSFR